MLNIIMATSFQYVQESNQVCICICIGIFKGVTYTGLRSEVYYAFEPLVCKQCRHFLTIGQVNFIKTEIVVLE